MFVLGRKPGYTPRGAPTMASWVITKVKLSGATIIGTRKVFVHSRFYMGVLLFEGRPFWSFCFLLLFLGKHGVSSPLFDTPT